MSKGQKTTVEITDSRTNLNIMGVFNLNDIGNTVIREYYSINVENIARFFIVTCETYPVKQKVHIILDGAGYHFSALVKEWTYVMNIDLYYLSRITRIQTQSSGCGK